ncbi:uncharacterized protein B0J16DRAFT_99158 [Fusarium flagelliforme]|uniref:uncharacterized protein n=1 Tax=Fusarium flagelliforme TaxID=2675880 RepID=UPI001E8E40BC|nr:uncharacterized protein B0J16DRAFT_99158 [Fusarium flagelliforme]KAH7188674.1 hypothetical protein B0J16DRAFT_99158 [Fusarium flagelliforme]
MNRPLFSRLFFFSSTASTLEPPKDPSVAFLFFCINFFISACVQLSIVLSGSFREQTSKQTFSTLHFNSWRHTNLNITHLEHHTPHLPVYYPRLHQTLPETRRSSELTVLLGTDSNADSDSDSQTPSQQTPVSSPGPLHLTILCSAPNQSRSSAARPSTNSNLVLSSVGKLSQLCFRPFSLGQRDTFLSLCMRKI